MKKINNRLIINPVLLFEQLGSSNKDRFLEALEKDTGKKPFSRSSSDLEQYFLECGLSFYQVFQATHYTDFKKSIKTILGVFNKRELCDIYILFKIGTTDEAYDSLESLDSRLAARGSKASKTSSTTSSKYFTPEESEEIDEDTESVAEEEPEEVEEIEEIEEEPEVEEIEEEPEVADGEEPEVEEVVEEIEEIEEPVKEINNVWIVDKSTLMKNYAGIYQKIQNKVPLSASDIEIIKSQSGIVRAYKEDSNGSYNSYQFGRRRSKKKSKKHHKKRH
jgi:hypothetical protein